jgi:NADH-quinone oxidoreductase subunit L
MKDMFFSMAGTLPNGIIEGGLQIDHLLLLLPLLPLIGALLVYTAGSIFSGNQSDEHSHDHGNDGHDDSHSHGHPSSKLPGILATLVSFSSFIIALMVFGKLDGSNAIVAEAWDWISVGGLHIPFSFRFDNLSGMMCLVITGIGTLIHLYAIGYMSHDPHPSRFFSYLNLFLSAMLILVLGDSLVLMFVGWEGVGLCSYLLIGFWYKEMPNAIAGQKAFVVNRIGDAGFLLGMFVLFLYTGTLAIPELLDRVGGMPPYAIELAAILLLIGAAGKSAQIPLYIWLPDAMAGPTPVSALIHAATMVTSGIYMITRLSALYAVAPYALLVVSIVGALTAFLAATIALVQNDIKKVLAYSTVSQLGYMFMALGAGAFSVGMYHVLTHAFFKALLFLAAGSVIVGCHHEQDMRKYGGLFKYMMFTAITYLVGTYAIAGLPYGSGFFSKDSVLWSVYSNPGLPSQIVLFNGWTLAQVLWGLGVLTAALTAFYMTRSFMMTFTGAYRGKGKPHESPWTMVLPLVVLSVPSLLFGFIYGDALMKFLSVWTRSDFLLGHAGLLANHTYHTLEVVSMWVAILSAVFAALSYSVLPVVPRVCSRVLAPLHTLLMNKWYVDEIFNVTVVAPLRFLSKAIFLLVDRLLIDGLIVNGSAIFVDTTGVSLKGFHSGKIGTAVIIMFSLFVFFLLFWMVM